MSNDGVTSLADLKEEILSQWKFRCRASISQASELSEAILTDTMPIFFDNLIQALENRRPFATAHTTLGFTHGRERAALTRYTTAQVIHELQLFRKALVDTAAQRSANLSQQQIALIDASIDRATRESAAGFCATQREQLLEFVSTFIHDLRNPLHVASATAQLIGRKSADQAVIDLAHRVRAKLDDADQLIHSLLDASAAGQHIQLRLVIMEVDLWALVHEVARGMELPSRPLAVLGEPVTGFWCRASIKRALENLVSNAQKYGDGSPVTIETRRMDSRVVVTVHNGGPAIPPEDLAKLFTGHRRLEDTSLRGWGIGLPFVQRVAEAHGGSIIVDSNPADGTSFQIAMPLDGRPFAG